MPEAAAGLVEADLTGDANADFRILLTNNATPVAGSQMWSLPPSPAENTTDPSEAAAQARTGSLSPG